MTEVLVDDRKIWWIASYPKSGNTWVRMFLNAYVTGFPVELNTPFQYTMGDNYPGYFQSVYCRPINQLTPTEQIMLRPAVLLTALNLCASIHLCLKTHHAKALVDNIPLIPAKISAGGVYIIRDPRDIVISYADHMGISVDNVIENMNNERYLSEHQETKLIHVLTSWSTHVLTWTDKNEDIPIRVFKYEDMLINTNEVFRQILNGLGFFNINEDRYNFALRETEFSNLQNKEKVHGFKEKGDGDLFFRIGKSGQWKSKLTNEQIKTIEKNHGEVMKKFGYL